MDAIRKIEAALPDVNYAMLAKHLGPNGANMLSRTVWKDGIDIEVPCEGIQTLCRAYAAQTLASKEAELVKLRADILPLQEFADAVFGEFPDHGDIDGFDLQDIAEACGLLKKESTVVPCGEACQCAEIGKPDGAASECYRVQPVMRRARIASARHSATTQPPKEPT